MDSCANWIKCAKFQNYLDVNNREISAEGIDKLCGDCSEYVPVRHWALPEPCPICGDLHRGRCVNLPSFIPEH